jgi:hypothetical protein
MMEYIQAGGEKKVTQTCNSMPCSHITAEDISRVKKHQKLDSRLIRTSKNSSLQKKKEVQPTNIEAEYSIDKLVLGK